MRKMKGAEGRAVEGRGKKNLLKKSTPKKLFRYLSCSETGFGYWLHTHTCTQVFGMCVYVCIKKRTPYFRKMKFCNFDILKF